MITVSLVIPCYNEEINIQKGVLDRIGNFVLENKKFIEVLIIDDGSSDKSAQIVKEKFLAKYPIFRLVEKKHQGKALAVIEGIKQAKGEYVIFSDIDLATPLEEAHKIIREFEKGENVVIGSRAKERSGAPISRRIQSVGFVLIRDIFIGLNGIVDTQCGFKGFNTKVANKIIDKLEVFNQKKMTNGSSVSAGFDLEFLFIAQKMGYKIVEVHVDWRHAETKNVHFMKDSFETIQDILTIKMNDIKGKYS
jgi:glycosyltransferase involved in cell wall biosynthesis